MSQVRQRGISQGDVKPSLDEPQARPVQNAFALSVRALMKRDGVSMAELAGDLGLSLSTLKRLFRSGDPSLKVLKRLSELFCLSLESLVAMMEQCPSPDEYLTEAQEEMLAQNRRCFALVGLLRQGLSLREIMERHNLQKSDVLPGVMKLESVGILKFSPRSFSVRFLIEPDFAIRPEGPLAQVSAPHVWLNAAEKSAARVRRELAEGKAPRIEGAAFQVSRNQLEKFRVELRELIASWRKRARHSRVLDPVNSGPAFFLADLDFMELDMTAPETWGR